ncbi:efflux RND transporter periplasmic adaptor subunit [Methylococcus sp. BF19-07]|uniref:efflux RND transporter periplasmic adaptor subunit n=1 Tax=Methylococcus sp. BF19-07 TaxID=2743472 RepID=UPI001E33359E|nr:hypothetical protein [Methylococcus sp. BF19-07]
MPPSRVTPPCSLRAAVLLCCVFSAAARAGDEAGTAFDMPVQQTGVVLEPARQRLAGIETCILEAVEYQPETRSLGRIVDIQPLLELRSRYRAAQAEAKITDAALRLARKNRDRLASLHSEAIVATRELIHAESQLAADEARAVTARQHVRELQEEGLQAWGAELFKAAVAGDSRLFDDLLQRRRVLILVTLHYDQALPAGASRIMVAREGDRQAAQPAELVSAAPRTDDIVQGETWFFHTDARKLRTGMRIEAWIPTSGEKLSGVVIPRSAQIWHEGRTWVYLQTGEDRFVRRPVDAHRDYGDAWFVESGIAPGESLVTRGAQLLLSEEQRHVIPEEED